MGEAGGPTSHPLAKRGQLPSGPSSRYFHELFPSAFCSPPVVPSSICSPSGPLIRPVLGSYAAVSTVLLCPGYAAPPCSAGSVLSPGGRGAFREPRTSFGL